MVDKWYLKLSLNIVAVFIIAIGLSYVPVKFPELFGDWLCKGREWIPSHHDETNEYILGIHKGCDHGGEASHNSSWHWGYQHWLWCLMGIALFIVQAFRIGEIINNKNKQNADKNNS